MPFPYFIRKLFQNDGAGEKLNPEIVPTTVNGVAADASGNIAINDSDIENGPFLPTAGGTVTGNLYVQSNLISGFRDVNRDPTGFNVSHRSNEYYMSVYGGEANGYKGGTGSALFLAGSRHGIDSIASGVPAGGFVLMASNEEYKSKFLRGLPDGSLTWLDAPIVCLSASSRGSQSWYRKYSDGWIEQGGWYRVNSASGTITFPIAFSTTNITVTTGIRLGGNYVTTFGVNSVSTTGFTYSKKNQIGEPESSASSWFACGY